MLADLLKIKRRREDDAVAALGEAQRSLERLGSARDAKARELDEYRRWQEEEKLRLYERLHNRFVSRDKLEDYREQVALLRQRCLQLEEELARSEQDLAAGEEALRQAHQRRLDAHREVVKLEEYQRTLDEEHARAVERKEEAEAEDVVSRRS